MKSLIICLSTLFIGCMLQQKNVIGHNSEIQIEVELSDTISKNQENILIILKVKNLTSMPVKIANPAHWGNAYPNISMDGNQVPMIKVKINPRIFDDLVTVNGNEIFETAFDYPLDRIINLNYCDSGNYKIHFELEGTTQAISNTFSFFVKDN